MNENASDLQKTEAQWRGRPNEVPGGAGQGRGDGGPRHGETGSKVYNYQGIDKKEIHAFVISFYQGSWH